MKLLFFILLFLSNLSLAYSNSLSFYIESAFKNNPILNAERKNFQAVKQNINISRSDFLPSISISGNTTSIQSTNQTNHSGASLDDSSRNTDTKTLSIDQKIFQGFQGFNSLKKSELEKERAKFNLINKEQQIILETVKVYFDLIYKTKKKEFNLENVDLFERQVEFDSARSQKGQITFTDLAQSESSLAGANANFISAKTELITAKTSFEKITRINPQAEMKNEINFKIDLPKSLPEVLKITKKSNPNLIIAKLDHEIAKKNVSIENSKLSPSASINYSKSENNDLSATINKSDKETVKATITWPIVQGGKNYSSIKKSKFKREQSSLLLMNAENDINTQATNAWSIYKSAGSVLTATQAQVKAAEIANEGITLEYDSGNSRTTLELIQSRSLLLDARISNAKAKRDYIISQFELLVQMGSLNINKIR